MPLKMIIDTDPGVDDALAILYAALHPEIELLGLTTVFGNVTVEQATRNALYLLERAGLDLPVAEGAAIPLVQEPSTPSHHVHGPEGFGAMTDIEVRGQKIDEGAAEFLVRMAREHRGELVLCPIGPITNIAHAIRLDPDFAGNLAAIVFMGGALDVPGNITPHAEANTYHDAEALNVVLQSGAKIRMIGLDVTNAVLLTETDFETLSQLHPFHGTFLHEIGLFYLDFYHSVGLEGCGLHDPMAVMSALMPDLLGTVETPLEVLLDPEVFGATRRSATGPAVEVAVACDPADVKARFFATFRDA